jgi:hypothetical protein
MTLTKNELREIDIREEIEELKKVIAISDFEDEIEASIEKIDQLEIELLTMGDDEEEYQRQAQERLDTMNDLDNSQI